MKKNYETKAMDDDFKMLKKSLYRVLKSDFNSLFDLHILVSCAVYILSSNSDDKLKLKSFVEGLNYDKNKK